jgi:hypothetical protein
MSRRHVFPVCVSKEQFLQLTVYGCWIWEKVLWCEVVVADYIARTEST